MTNLDYNNFETPTGQWSGSASAAPTHYGEYKALFTDLAGVERPNGVITFDNLPANLKIVSGNGLNLPFDRVYVDIDGHTDYVMLDSNGDGNYGTGDFLASYTSGGFWLMGDSQGNSPGVIFMASGSAPTSTADILNLDWKSLSSSAFDESGAYPNPLYFDMASNDAIVFSKIYNGASINVLRGFIFNKNEYSWQKKIFHPIIDDPFDFAYFTGPSGLRVTGLDSNGIGKSFLFTYDDLVPEAIALAFWWEGNTLTGQIFTNEIGSISAPSPFSLASIVPSTYAEYIDATVYADEPMISYSVINNNTIQITSDINNVISPLRKLYLNFSGIP
jgi:hypothetical protein